MDFFFFFDEVMRKIESMNRVGKMCADAGIAFLYHNHFLEFQIFQGKTIMDLILENADPKYVAFELDTYWLMRGGQNPVETLKKLGTRVRLIHQKDYPAEFRDQINLIDAVNRDNIYLDHEYFMRVKDPRTFTEIGTGIMPIQDIINTGNTVCKSEFIVLEQDHTTHDEMESISISMASFKKFQGIEW
jgi:sugar phosphate isomerase/epimerase